MASALIVEGHPGSLARLAQIVEDEGIHVTVTSAVHGARGRLREATPDILFVDLTGPETAAKDLLRDPPPGRPRTIVVTAARNDDGTAEESAPAGPWERLSEPCDAKHIRSMLSERIREHGVAGNRCCTRTLPGDGSFPMVGTSAAIQRVRGLVKKVATTNATVLVTGESGTGKELVAQTIHRTSRRRHGPLVVLNCAAITPTLMESELFGHERGSFTGALRMHRGCFERAANGTLFLDEIAEMPLELQAKLLRALETGDIERVGGERPVHADVRVIAATNHAAEDALAEGKLREDLLYRLQVFPIHLPPLREREHDVILLAQHFLNQLNSAEGTYKRFSRSALKRLAAYHWPGNVRELKNAVHRAFILVDLEIVPALLPRSSNVDGGRPTGTPTLSVPVGLPLAEVERRLIMATLEECHGDKRRAADLLQVSLKTIYNKVNLYEAVDPLSTPE